MKIHIILKKSVFLQTKSYSFMKTHLSLCVKELRKNTGLLKKIWLIGQG